MQSHSIVFVSFHACSIQVAQERVILPQIDIALVLDLTLIRLLCVASVNLVHKIHARNDTAKRSETLRIEKRVVLVVDEELSGTRVGSRGSIRDGAPLVRLNHRIVLDGRVIFCR